MYESKVTLQATCMIVSDRSTTLNAGGEECAVVRAIKTTDL